MLQRHQLAGCARMMVVLVAALCQAGCMSMLIGRFGFMRAARVGVAEEGAAIGAGGLVSAASVAGRFGAVAVSRAVPALASEGTIAIRASLGSRVVLSGTLKRVGPSVYILDPAGNTLLQSRIQGADIVHLEAGPKKVGTSRVVSASRIDHFQGNGLQKKLVGYDVMEGPESVLHFDSGGRQLGRTEFRRNLDAGAPSVSLIFIPTPSQPAKKECLCRCREDEVMACFNSDPNFQVPPSLTNHPLVEVPRRMRMDMCLQVNKFELAKTSGKVSPFLSQYWLDCDWVSSRQMPRQSR